MPRSNYDYLVISHAAEELGIPAPTLRRYCDIGLVNSKRASDGSRLFSPEAITTAKEKLRLRKKAAQNSTSL